MCRTAEDATTTLLCTLPSFTTSGPELKSNISYTLKYGAAPGPDLTVETLTIAVRPNPAFTEDGSALFPTTFSSGTGGLLRIIVRFNLLNNTKNNINLFLYKLQGTNLNSVERREIVVTVEGELCEGRTSASDNPNIVSQYTHY